MATKTALEFVEQNPWMKLRPCILNGKVSSKGVTLKCASHDKPKLDAFLIQFKLESKLIKGKANLIAVMSIDAFNAATAEIEEPKPLDLSSFDSGDESNMPQPDGSCRAGL